MFDAFYGFRRVFRYRLEHNRLEYERLEDNRLEHNRLLPNRLEHNEWCRKTFSYAAKLPHNAIANLF